MSESLQRTIRRCTAVLAIPLSLSPMAFVARLETDGYPLNAVLRAADEAAAVVLLGAVVYLTVSVLAEVVRTEPRPEATAADRTD